MRCTTKPALGAQSIWLNGLAWAHCGCVVLADIVALSPRGRLLERDVARRFRHSTRTQVERECMSGLVDAFWTMCAVFFVLHPSRTATVATVVRFDYFPIAAIYLRLLSERIPPRTDERSSVDTLVALVQRIACERSRPRHEVESEVIAAYLLATALRNTRGRLPTFDRLDPMVVRNDALFASLGVNPGLREVVLGVVRLVR